MREASKVREAKTGERSRERRESPRDVREAERGRRESREAGRYCLMSNEAQ